MSFLQILVLAIVQGLTEFLPVSSSGHLILVPQLTGWPDQGLAIDVASHVGTLFAVVVYFWRDVWRMLTGLGRLATGRVDSGARLVGYLLIGTVPALIVGLLVERYAGDAFRQMKVIAWTMVIFGIVLYLADRLGLTVNKLADMRFGHAVIVGLAQTLAFVPGTSRSGITMVAARLLGYERPEAARFSFLLSIPAISAAGLYEGVKLFENASATEIHDALLTAAFSAIAGFAAIAFLMRWLKRSTFTPFVIYRLLFGGFLLYLVYFAA